MVHLVSFVAVNVRFLQSFSADHRSLYHSASLRSSPGEDNVAVVAVAAAVAAWGSLVGFLGFVAVGIDFAGIESPQRRLAVDFAYFARYSSFAFAMFAFC